MYYQAFDCRLYRLELYCVPSRSVIVSHGYKDGALYVFIGRPAC